MPEEWFDSKKELLLQYKKETEQQLQAIIAEDSERFLISIQVCGQIITEINHLDQQTVHISNTERLELRNIVAEVIEIRDQISGIAPKLYSKLQKAAVAEQRSTQINRAYSQEHYQVPSIFYDKRK